MSAAGEPVISVIVLTTGNRPTELAAALDSVLGQRGVDVEVVVVANGVAPAALDLTDDQRLRVVPTAANLGIPGGRNLGVANASAELVAMLDDDARFVDADVLARSVQAFGSNDRLATLALRIVDEDGQTARRHVPRIGARAPDRSAPVTAFLGGAVVIRRRAFEQVGGFDSEFFYAMEETDLALRLVDQGWELHYDGIPAVVHPRTDPARHRGSAERTMRNRVWLAYRNLPAALAVLYVTNWALITTMRAPRHVTDVIRGVIGGWRSRPVGRRSPIGWTTVARLTRLGRPPVL